MSNIKYCLTLYILFASVLFTIGIYIKQGSNDLAINNFAFGSCYNTFNKEKRMDMFNTILSKHPDLFVWLGDVTYLDDFNYKLILRIAPEYSFTKAKKRYDEAYYNESYKTFREVTPIIGIWDDHDYQHDNAIGSASDKDRTRNLFLDFLDVPNTSQRRLPGKGIYSSYSFGSGYKSFKIILPDLRYDKTVNQMMGESQWEWLEKELDSKETFVFIGSGIQFLPVNRGFGWNVQEFWYIKDRDRLMKLIGKMKRSGVIILSGDVHYGQILKTTCIHPDIGYPLYEHTSSGLSHHARIADILVNNVFPNNYQIHPNLVDYFNFGMVEFNWGDSKENSSLKLEIHDIDKIMRVQVEVKYKELIYNESFKNNNACREEFRFILPFKDFIKEKIFKRPLVLLICIFILIVLYTLLKYLFKLIFLILSLPFWLIKLLLKKKKEKND